MCVVSLKGIRKGDAYMLRKINDAVWVVALSVICGLLVWHVVGWHMAGFYSEMFDWVGTGKECLTVLYNIFLMLVLGLSLGLFMEKIIDLLGYELRAKKHFDEDI